MENKIEQLNATHLFSAPVYQIVKPEFLDVARKVSKKFISKRKCEVDLNPIYPVYMTESINFDPEMLDFANYVAQIAWNILANQGYAMDVFSTYFTEMWVQEHHHLSLMERHIHGNGAVISGFYFLDCPQKSSRVLFHHPTDAKVISNLPEKNIQEMTHASNMINFVPEEGLLMFTNAWVPHSFTKNESKKPMRFIHFNIAVMPAIPQSCEKPQVEVI
jgi:uncharacterized protein (TIGR02466 family)